MDKQTNKLVIGTNRSVEDGVLSIIGFVKQSELATGKTEKAVLTEYSFEGSYALATLIKNFYREELSFAVLSVVNTQTGANMQHACVVQRKNAGKEVVETYYDINGKKTLDEMKKYVARFAKASYKNVEVKDGHFYAVTNRTTVIASNIERNVKTKANKDVKKVATKTATKPVAKKTTAVKKPVAKKPATKTVAKKPVATKKTTTAKKPATKPVATKPVVKKATTTKKPVAKKATSTKKQVAKKTTKAKK